MPSSSRSPTRALKRRTTVPSPTSFVDVGEVLERRGDVGEDLADDLAPLEAAEEDRAVQDDVLAQRLRHQIDVLRFGGAAEGMWLGHAHSTASTALPCGESPRGILAAVPLLSDQLLLARSRTRSAPPGCAGPASSTSPLYRLSGGRIGGKVGKAPVLLLTTTGRKSGQQRTAPVVYLRRRRAAGRDQHQRRQRQGAGLVAEPEGEPRGRGRGRPQAPARYAPASPRARSAPTSGASTTSSTRASTTTRRAARPRQPNGASCSSRARGTPASSRLRGASAPRAGASAFSACCSRSGGSARG